MTDRELSSFVNKFRQLLSDGNIAKLVMECESGCAGVNLEVFLNPYQGHQPHPPEQQHHQHHQRQVHPRAAGPARLRRRVRRAQARQAADQADKEQVKPDVSLPPHNDVLLPSDHQHSPHPVAEEAAHHHPPDTVEEAVNHHPLHSVEEAAHHHHHPIHSVEEAAHHQSPHTVEEATHNHPLLTVDNAALCQPPNPVEEAANSLQHLAGGEAVEYLQHNVLHAAGAVHCYDVISPLRRGAAKGFPPLSYTPKEVFLPPAAPLQEDVAQGDVEAPPCPSSSTT